MKISKPIYRKITEEFIPSIDQKDKGTVTITCTKPYSTINEAWLYTSILRPSGTPIYTPCNKVGPEVRKKIVDTILGK